MRAVLIVILSFVSTGCATVMTGGGTDQNVRIHTNPKGAAVYVDGDLKGPSPVSVMLDRRNDHYVRVEATGYQLFEQEIHTGMNGWVLGNALVGGLVGTGIDIASGANVTLSPTDVSATLVKEPTVGTGYAGTAATPGRPPDRIIDYAHGETAESASNITRAHPAGW